MQSARRLGLTVLACYYVATGVWPMIGMRSFEAVTGPKIDKWLVKTVGALALANGVTLALGLRRRPVAFETLALAISSIVAFSTIDVVYVARGRIRPIYLADTFVELVLAAAILARAEPTESPPPA